MYFSIKPRLFGNKVIFWDEQRGENYKKTIQYNIQYMIRNVLPEVVKHWFFEKIIVYSQGKNT